MADIHICETGPRDGLQNLSFFVPTEAKIALVNAIAAAGVPEIDVGSFVSPKAVPQFSDVDLVVDHAKKIDGIIVNTLVTNLRGMQRAITAEADIVDFVLSVSESHNQANVRRTVAEQVDVFKEARAAIDGATTSKKPLLIGGISTAFGCSIEGRISEAAVCSLASRLAEAGADEISLADTVGYATPPLIKQLVTAVRREIGPELPLRLHLHDTLGLALANAVAGLEVGIRRFDAAVSGLGGCPFAPGARGNVVSEDLVFMFEEMGFTTGIDLEKLMETRAILAAHIPADALTGHLHRAGIPAALRRAA